MFSQGSVPRRCTSQGSPLPFACAPVHSHCTAHHTATEPGPLPCLAFRTLLPTPRRPWSPRSRPPARGAHLSAAIAAAVAHPSFSCCAHPDLGPAPALAVQLAPPIAVSSLPGRNFETPARRYADRCTILGYSQLQEREAGSPWAALGVRVAARCSQMSRRNHHPARAAAGTAPAAFQFPDDLAICLSVSVSSHCITTQLAELCCAAADVPPPCLPDSSLLAFMRADHKLTHGCEWLHILLPAWHLTGKAWPEISAATTACLPPSEQQGPSSSSSSAQSDRRSMR